MTEAPKTDGSAARAASETMLLLRAQHAMYAALESLARRQRSLISGEHTGLLLTALADRQKLSGKLKAIAEKLEPVRRDWAASRECLSPSQRDEADRLVRETQAYLRRVIERDEEDTRLLSVRRQAAARALGAAHATGQAISAYRVPPGRRGRLDQMDEEQA